MLKKGQYYAAFYRNIANLTSLNEKKKANDALCMYLSAKNSPTSPINHFLHTYTPAISFDADWTINRHNRWLPCLYNTVIAARF
jgi:hypothetical protein